MNANDMAFAPRNMMMNLLSPFKAAPTLGRSGPQVEMATVPKGKQGPPPSAPTGRKPANLGLKAALSKDRSRVTQRENEAAAHTHAPGAGPDQGPKDARHAGPTPPGPQ